MGAPVRHTCPDIDRVKRQIIEARKILHDLQRLDDMDEARKYADYADSELDGLDTMLEELRSDNSDLRSWGYEMQNKVEELEAHIIDLQEQQN